MESKILNFSNKTFCVYGLGTTGTSLLRWFKKNNLKNFEAWDDNEALMPFKKRKDVNIFTDSKYVKNGITEWIHKWKINGWKTANKKPVKNKDLWIILDQEITRHKINWQWIKGHSQNKFNELADQLSNM